MKGDHCKGLKDLSCDKVIEILVIMRHNKRIHIITSISHSLTISFYFILLKYYLKTFYMCEYILTLGS